ncbi:MAG TPA: acetoacetate--CoA ligase, partial [Acidimicrobiaceae bacterium]|nr:acetoacetate--CoA ligase [Acidimicrobiaceae bacterium]
RIGTAEIYAQVEQVPGVVEAVAVGQEWEGDTRIVLFVKLAPGVDLTDALQAEIRQRLRRNASPRHVPARIAAVTDVPRTRSNKISELAVADVVNGREVRNTEALANPEALAEYHARPELAV